MTEKTIMLGGQEYTLRALPLGKLKKVIPAVSTFSIACANVAQGVPLDEADFDVAAQALAVALDKPVSEINDMPMQLEQVIDAVTALAEVCGLAAKGTVAVGEAQPGTIPATTSTQSTASSVTS